MSKQFVVIYLSFLIFVIQSYNHLLGDCIGASNVNRTPSVTAAGAYTRSRRHISRRIYYHFDYVGGPRNYKWLNTNPISKVWEQMNLAYQYDARRIWIVNVGDLKPMEFPMEYFLSLAWDPRR